MMKAKKQIASDVNKSIFIIIVLILLGGLGSAYTPEQQMTIEGMNLRCQLCTAYEKAIQGGNVTKFNYLVDIYNTWIKQHFAGEGANTLLMTKISATNLAGIAQKQQVENRDLAQKQQAENRNLTQMQVTMRNFNTSSDLSKFGKRQVKSVLTGPGFDVLLEDTISQRKMKNL